MYVDNQDAQIGNCAFGHINNLERHNLPNTYQCIEEEDGDYVDCHDGTQDVCEEVCDDETGECWDECI